MNAPVLAALVEACSAPPPDPRLERAATVAELAATTGLPSHTVVSILCDLGYRGLVHRSRPHRIVRGDIIPIRRPRLVYSPTDRGRAVAASLR